MKTELHKENSQIEKEIENLKKQEKTKYFEYMDEIGNEEFKENEKSEKMSWDLNQIKKEIEIKKQDKNNLKLKISATDHMNKQKSKRTNTYVNNLLKEFAEEEKENDGFVWDVSNTKLLEHILNENCFDFKLSSEQFSKELQLKNMFSEKLLRQKWTQIYSDKMNKSEESHQNDFDELD